MEAVAEAVAVAVAVAVQEQKEQEEQKEQDAQEEQEEQEEKSPPTSALKDSACLAYMWWFAPSITCGTAHGTSLSQNGCGRCKQRE